MKIIVQYLSRCQKEGRYETDSSGDYDEEFYVCGGWNTKLIKKEFDILSSEDIEKIFDYEEADYDSSISLHLILDSNKNVLYNPTPQYNESKYSYDHRKRMFFDYLKAKILTEEVK